MSKISKSTLIDKKITHTCLNYSILIPLKKTNKRPEKERLID